jgi:hypothetical protein
MVMNARKVAGWVLGGMLAGTAVAGLAQNNLGFSQTTVPSAEVPAPTLLGFEPSGIASTSPAFSEFVKLAQAGIDERVMLMVVTNTADAFSLGVDQILWLRDVGVPKEVINAMLAHDMDVNSRQLSLAAAAPSTAAAPTRIAWPASWLASSAPTTAQPAKDPAPSPTPISFPTPTPPAVARASASLPTQTSAVAAVEPATGLAGTGFSPGGAAGAGAQQPGSLPTVDAAQQPSEYWGNPYPVRLPYPVKLLDPIIIMVRPW